MWDLGFGIWVLGYGDWVLGLSFGLWCFEFWDLGVSGEGVDHRLTNSMAPVRYGMDHRPSKQDQIAS
jgi:hypothetical protein